MDRHLPWPLSVRRSVGWGGSGRVGDDRHNKRRINPLQASIHCRPGDNLIPFRKDDTSGAEEGAGRTDGRTRSRQIDHSG